LPFSLKSTTSKISASSSLSRFVDRKAAFGIRGLTFVSLLSLLVNNYQIPPDPTHTFGNKNIRIEMKGRTFFFFAIDANGVPFREEFVVLEVFGMTATTASLAGRQEVEISGYDSVEYLDNNNTVRFNATLANGAHIALSFQFDKPKFGLSSLIGLICLTICTYRVNCKFGFRVSNFPNLNGADKFTVSMQWSIKSPLSINGTDFASVDPGPYSDFITDIFNSRLNLAAVRYNPVH